MKANVDIIRNVLRYGGNIVVLSGMQIVFDIGINGVRSENISYDVEQKYGYCGDEIASSLFFSRRVDLFFDYYKNVILENVERGPSDVHRGITKLQNYGKLKTVITRSVYGLHQKAGCNCVIELHGSIEDNYCPICGRKYGSGYIKDADGVPKCEKCNVPLRPGFSLMGETIDNGKISRASRAVEEADILLILGASINSPLCRYMVKYYTGDRMILINNEEKPGDDVANFRAYGNITEIFNQAMDF